MDELLKQFREVQEGPLGESVDDMMCLQQTDVALQEEADWSVAIADGTGTMSLDQHNWGYPAYIFGELPVPVIRMLAVIVLQVFMERREVRRGISSFLPMTLKRLRWPLIMMFLLLPTCLFKDGLLVKRFADMLVVSCIVLQVHGEWCEVQEAILDLCSVVKWRLTWPVRILSILWLVNVFKFQACKEIITNACEIYYMILIFLRIKGQQPKTASFMLFTMIAFKVLKMWTTPDFWQSLIIDMNTLLTYNYDIGYIVLPLSSTQCVLNDVIPILGWNEFIVVFQAMYPGVCEYINLLYFSGMVVWLSINDLPRTPEWNEFALRFPLFLFKLKVRLMQLCIILLV